MVTTRNALGREQSVLVSEGSPCDSKEPPLEPLLRPAPEGAGKYLLGAAPVRWRPHPCPKGADMGRPPASTTSHNAIGT